MKRKIIGICGFIGCGKGTVGDILVKSYNFKKLSFADTLKDGVAAVYGWDRELLEGVTDESRKWRETPDEFWTKELGRDITPRYVLQLFGTDCMRYGFDKEIWVLTLKKKLQENPGDNFVVPDVRFYNERDMIKSIGGQVWRIKRGPNPDWMKKAINDNRYDTNWMKEYPKIHESEWRWLDYDSEFDCNINNEGALKSLQNEIEKAIKS